MFKLLITDKEGVSDCLFYDDLDCLFLGLDE